MNPNPSPEQEHFLKLDEICDQFEQSWQSGQAPSLSAALAHAADGDQQKLLSDLLLIDLRYRLQRDQQLPMSQYQLQLPTHAETISDVFVRLQDADDTLVNKQQEQLRDTTRMHSPQDLEAATLQPGEPASQVLANLDEIGSEFGDYQLLEEIGRGGMGVVFRARQKSLDREVAVKMILAGGLADEQAIERFYAEAQAVAQLQHPNIVRVYEVGEHQGHHFFSMDYIQGQSLAEVARNQALSAKEAADYIRTIAEAVHCAHEAGIIHRDLKPANILTDATGQPLITDFGLAKRTEDDSGLTATGNIMGTPSYMPPEQVGMKQETIGPASDVYAMGAILYELLTGRPPFRGESTMETLLQVLEQEPVAPRILAPQLDRDLETITLKCLQKTPSQRYATAAELAEELGRYWSGQPIEARPVSKLERAWKWARRRPAVAGLSATVLLLLLLMGTVGPGLALQQWNLRVLTDNALAAQRQAERERRFAQANAIRQATPQAAAMILQELQTDSSEVQESLREMLADASLPVIEINRIRLALLATDREQLEPIVQLLLSEAGRQLKPEELLLIRGVLEPHGSQLTARFLPLLQQPSDRLRAACLLAGFAPKADFWLTQADLITEALVNVLPSELVPYREALRPVQHHLTDPLARIFRDDEQSEQVRSFATETLAHYHANSPAGLFNFLVDANRNQFSALFNRLTAHQTRAIALGNAEITKVAAHDASEEDKEALAVHQANAALMLLRMGIADPVWPLLRHSSDPRLRSYIINWFSPLVGDATLIVARLPEESDATIKRALLLCLGGFNESQLGVNEWTRLTKTLLDLYRSEPDAGLHSAAEWVLRQWKQGEQIAKIDNELRQTEEQPPVAPDNPRQWYINGHGQTFVILDVGEFQMGSPESETWRQNHEKLHRRRIGRRFAISTKEVTKAQWRGFPIVVWTANQKLVEYHSRTEDSPMCGMTWYEAAWYCNWLSEQEGISEDQWCYELSPEKKYGPGMRAKANFLELRGYRLPTEAEWEYACRAGTRTSRYYGQSETLFRHYAWYQHNSENHTWPVASLKPNDFGLFDMYGNVMEWCYNTPEPLSSSFDKVVEDAPATDVLSESATRIIRGGAFGHTPNVDRSSARRASPPGYRSTGNGFRVVRTYP